jgi:hypothetical protein
MPVDRGSRLFSPGKGKEGMIKGKMEVASVHFSKFPI